MRTPPQFAETEQPGLLAVVRRRLRELLGGYFNAPELMSAEGVARYVVPPGLGYRAGVLGAIALARRAVQAPILDPPVQAREP